MKYGKTAEPKADDETEPTYEEVPNPVNIHSNILPQENNDNLETTLSDDASVPF